MSDPFDPTGTQSLRGLMTLNGQIPSSAALPLQLLAHLIKEGRLRIGSQFAKYILADMNYVRQRRITTDHVGKLAYQMKAGKWTPGSQIAFVRLPDGSMHLINGQHRLHAVIDSGMEIEFQILIVDVSSVDELHESYWKQDGVLQIRTNHQILKSAGKAEEYEIQKRTAVAVYSAGPIIAHKLDIPSAFREGLGTPDGRLEAAHPWWKQAKIYDELIKPAPKPVKRRLLNASVTAVALITLKAQEDKAREFWSGIAKNDGLAKSDPRSTLIWALISKNMKGSAGSILAITCVAWNHFYLGSEVSILRPAKVNYLLGTPFSRGYRYVGDKRKEQEDVVEESVNEVAPVERTYAFPWDVAP